MDESVLHRHIGPPQLMQSQYRRLLDVSEEANVTIQILPLDGAVYNGAPASFTVMGLPHPDPEVVVIEYRGGTLYLERSDDVAVHAHVFDRIRADALGPGESIKQISRVSNELSLG
jgi:hypothetical protein